MEATSGRLFVVATPLGNLEDLSQRAARVLAEVDLIACEDTRHTGKLLQHLGVRTPTTSYHEHNERSKAPKLVAELKSGKDVALVSDAGTPLLSDPGYRLVQSCRLEKISVIPIPGPSAAVAALSVAGLPTDRFLFAGFLPSRRAAAKKELARLSSLEMTLVFYVSPHRLQGTLRQMLEVLGNRNAFLIREMTKIYESGCHGTLQEILETVQSRSPRGEYTLVVQGKGRR